MDIPKNRITSFIGPSGCGKSTLLRCYNRLNDLIKTFGAEGKDITTTKTFMPLTYPVEVRRQIGMVFQGPNPFPNQFMTSPLVPELMAIRAIWMN